MASKKDINKEIDVDADEAEEGQGPRLPQLDDGEMASVVSVALLERATRKPTPYTEGTLLDDMKGAAKFVNDPELRKALRQKEVSGIGTAATRAETIEKLKSAGYIEVKGKKLIPTPKGMAFIQWLDSVMPELTDVALTAQWQAKLDVVAESGGGAGFFNEVATDVRRIIEVFKKAPPMQFASTTTEKGSSTMSENRSSKPTEKMLDFAKRIATKINAELPAEAIADFDACKKFIDDNKDAAMRPTEKQLAFAQRIAGEKGVAVPDEALADGRKLSEWIDANKA